MAMCTTSPNGLIRIPVVDQPSQVFVEEMAHQHLMVSTAEKVDLPQRYLDIFSAHSLSKKRFIS
jgi:hypothetical protein